MHEKTAQFWMKYEEVIHLYHDFSRCVCTGDFNIYVSSIPKTTNYFFALNQPSYACWLVKYHNNLLVAPDTHPEVYQEFKKGMFGIKRSSKSFSRSPMDLALEQTINADAANQRTGISSLTNPISARQQWTESHFLRMSVISNLFTELNMTKKEDITSTLKPHNVKNDNMCLGQILDMIKANMNPFGTINPLYLFNIATD